MAGEAQERQRRIPEGLLDGALERAAVELSGAGQAATGAFPNWLSDSR